MNLSLFCGSTVSGSFWALSSIKGANAGLGTGSRHDRAAMRGSEVALGRGEAMEVGKLCSERPAEDSIGSG